MDFDIGNIIYIIATLVAVAVGLFGNKKKKPGQTGKSPVTQKKNTGSGAFSLRDLEQILSGGQPEPGVVDLKPYEEDLLPEEELAGNMEEIPDSGEVVAESDTVQAFSDRVDSGSRILDNYELLMSQRGENESDLLYKEGHSSTGELEVIELEAEDRADYFEIINDFNAGRAIVYSAIINRIDY